VLSLSPRGDMHTDICAALGPPGAAQHVSGRSMFPAVFRSEPRPVWVLDHP
jgi:hypothetical protein